MPREGAFPVPYGNLRPPCDTGVRSGDTLRHIVGMFI